MIPSLRGWHEKFGGEGLVIIGNHYPEFSYEGDLEKLKEAIEELAVFLRSNPDDIEALNLRDDLGDENAI